VSPVGPRPLDYRSRTVWITWKRRLAFGGAALVALCGIGVGVYFLVDALNNKSEQASPPPAPKIVVHTKKPQPKAAQDLGFPEFATKNTTRVAGADPTATAAGVALAAFPSTGGVPGPDAVSLVDSSDWQSGIAAASLTSPPVSAPILLSGRNSIPSLTQDAVSALGPGGSAATRGVQVFRVGDAASPSGVDVQHVTGKDPAAVAAQIDALRQKLTGTKPASVLLVSTAEPQYAMPAASWAARSGDPVLFVSSDSVPKPTIEALKRDKGANVYALGPPSAISDKVLTNAGSATSKVVRIGDPDPVQNAIDFARYSNGSFGWNITDPGHGLVIASDKDPMDAPAAAALSASGTWGPLLVTDDPARVPESLRGFLLDIKPGYVDDPTRAVYNHVWIIGDQTTISVGFQAQVDDLAEVAPVRSATGTSVKPPPQSPSRQKNGKSSK
jgi:putative cell wall binding repeat protein